MPNFGPTSCGKSTHQAFELGQPACSQSERSRWLLGTLVVSSVLRPPPRSRTTCYGSKYSWRPRKLNSRLLEIKFDAVDCRLATMMNVPDHFNLTPRCTRSILIMPLVPLQTNLLRHPHSTSNLAILRHNVAPNHNSALNEPNQRGITKTSGYAH